jgi:aspartyl-tRNA(Asn)/glutamyl-tRNA(Gln) amidotransferase subunit C
MPDSRPPISEKDVLYVAELAHLELTAGERARMDKDLNSILDYVDRLNELDTSNVEPMAQISDRFGIDESKTGAARFAYAMREDNPGPSLPREVVMENAPETDGAFFKVPKVIER